ncbi:amino acid adenylation domain-containing protein [Pseudoalteromonas sp. TB41]|uniref:amino acid adenylation domain-containing protein n=1 Tax=Pseudoalteromonas sp. TB41 TaxID=985149 RepID=UPI001300C807|nr:amino acid adenylation domain-containing protein [Pseudoalteromonas sp. TB41]
MLLTFSDGIADLIIISANPLVYCGELQQLAQKIVACEPAQQAGISAPHFLDLAPVKIPGYGSPVASWAKLDPVDVEDTRHTGAQCIYEQHRAFIPGAQNLATLLIAVARVLTVFYGESSPVIAGAELVQTDPKSARQTSDRLRLIPLAISSPKSSITQEGERLLEAWQSAVSCPRDRLDTDTVSIGVFWGTWLLQPSEVFAEQHYYPYLAPPLPLSIEAQPLETGVALVFNFDTAHYDQTGVENLVDCINNVALQIVNEERLSKQATEHRALSYAELSIIDKDRLSADMALLNNVSDDAENTQGSRELRIEQAFSVQVKCNSDAVALTLESQQVSYGELQMLANQYTRALQEAGVKPGDKVGICVMRSPQLIALMLATMHAGAVYVPMDPSYPAERLQYTVADAAMALVIGECPSCEETNIMSLEAFTLAASTQSNAPVQSSSSDAGQAAYMIYTSGSSGKPKGVMVPHRNVISLLAATKDNFSLSGQDVWTLFHSTAFDFSVWEIWGALLTGGKLVIVPYWVSRSAEAFYQLVVDEKVTVLNQTPSAFYQFIEAEFQHSRACDVRLVIFGGEPLDAKALLPWMQRYSELECRLVNMFGITETTVHVTWHDVTRQDALAGSKSVGTALPSWYCYVMDEKMNPLPPGLAGEICVGGAGVALGYHGKPELSAEKFVDDPLRSGNRLYRSGDKGRLMPDGSLEHLGRLDQQVKLRGYRIELGEIRHTLLGLPDVQGAAVLLQQPEKQDAASARLEAYLQTHCEDLTPLKQLAAQTLPEYMLPTKWHRVSEFPLTANGKLDTKALPERIINSASANEPVAHEQTAAQMSQSEASDRKNTAHSESNGRSQSNADKMLQQMIAIWREVLGCEVSANDNFFDLGGNSLYAMRIMSELKKRNLPSFSTRELYVHQTISELSCSLSYD